MTSTSLPCDQPAISLKENRSRTRLGPRRALLLEVAAAVSSSSSGPFGKTLIDSGWSAGGVLLVRMALSVSVLLLPAAWLARRRSVTLRGNVSGILVLGVVGIAGTVICYYNAIATLPIGVAMMVLYTSPVLVLAWIWVRHQERPAPMTFLGAGVCIGGLLLVVSAMGVATPSPAGIAWAFGGAVCVATYFMASDKATASVPPVTLACAGLIVAVSTIGLLALVGVLPVRIRSGPVDLGGLSVSPAVPIVIVGCVSTVFVYVAAFTAVSVLGARVTSFVALAEPVSALGVAWLLLGEAPHLGQIAGCALIVGGVVLIRSDRSQRLRRGVKADAVTTPFLPDPG